jgi:hypothetical protein
VNRNCPVSVGGSVRHSASEGKTENGIRIGVSKIGNSVKIVFAALAVLAAGFAFYPAPGLHPVKASAPPATGLSSPAISSKAMSLPLFFEANQGQTASQVKFLARGSGYGLFLTADEAVLELRHVSHQPSAVSRQAQPSASAVMPVVCGLAPAIRSGRVWGGTSSGEPARRWRGDGRDFLGRDERLCRLVAIDWLGFVQIVVLASFNLRPC